jgi:signal transduction histidine kinase
MSLGLELIRGKSELNCDEDALFLMQGSVDYMTETFKDILDIQNADEGVLELHFTAFLIEDTLKFLVSKFSSTLKSKRVSLIFEIGSNVPASVFGDKEKIDHVLGNFVGNSIKYSESNQNVRLAVSFDDGLVQFSVFDQGLEIDPEARQNMFLPFVSLSSHVKKLSRCSDAGLVISKEIVTLHGGVIGLRSSIESPITNEFFFSIPFEIGVDSKNQGDLLTSKVENIVSHIAKYSIQGITLNIVTGNVTVPVIIDASNHVDSVDNLSLFAGKCDFTCYGLIVDGKKEFRSKLNIFLG